MERARRAVGRVPAAVWSVTALHLVVLLVYSILIPTFRAPDEHSHADLAHLFADTGRYPGWDERDVDSGVLRAMDLTRWAHHPPDLAADEAIPKGQRPSFEDLADPTRERLANHIPQHPPLYYMLAGTVGWAFQRVVGEPSFDLEVWVYRLVSIALMAPLPLIIWRVSSRLRLPTAVGIAACLVPLAIPQLTHIGSVVNNDSLMLLLFWLLTPVVLRLADGELTPRVAALAGAITGLALLTKGFALVLPLWVLGALLLAVMRAGRVRLRSAAVVGAVYGVVTLAVGGWWWVRNLVTLGTLSRSRYSELVPYVDDVKVDLSEFVQRWATETTLRFWGDLGVVEVRLPALAVWIATVVAVFALVMGCRRRDRVAGSSAGDRWLLAAPLVLLVALQFALVFRGNLKTGTMPGLQGRYWFGAVVGFAVVMAIGLANAVDLARLARRWQRLLPLAVLAGVAAMQSIAVPAALRYYWGDGDSGLRDQLRAMAAWAPLPGEMLAVGALVGAAVIALVVVQLALLAARSPDGPGGDGVPSDDESLTSDPGKTLLAGSRA